MALITAKSQSPAHKAQPRTAPVAVEAAQKVVVVEPLQRAAVVQKAVAVGPAQRAAVVAHPSAASSAQ